MVDISVIVPTYNRINQLKKMIKALEDQSLSKDNFEVIIVSDGSSDGTNEYLKGLTTSIQLHPIVQENSGAAVARNTGAQAAKGDVILFLDDDILPDPDLIRNHILMHSKIGLKDIVLGPMLTPKDWQLSPWVDWEQVKLEQQYQSMLHGVYQPSARQFFTGNASLKRKFFFMNSGFDPHFRRAEDVEFAYRAATQGAKFIFYPEAKGYHYAQRSLESWMQTAYIYGANDVTFTYEKGVDWLLPKVFKEYKKRNIILRMTLPLFLDRKNSQASLIRFFKALGLRSYHKNFVKISRFAFSFIFNMQYYQGVSDRLGGRKKFFANLN